MLIADSQPLGLPLPETTCPFQPIALAAAATPPAERYPRSKFLEASTIGLGVVIGGLVISMYLPIFQLGAVME